jgi:hypothetical protein
MNKLKIVIEEIVLRYIKGEGSETIAKEIADNVFSTAIWSLVCDGTQGDVQRARALLSDIHNSGVLGEMDSLNKRITKFLDELDKRGEDEAEKEFGLPNEEMYEKSDGTLIPVGDMHEAYLRNAFRKMLRIGIVQKQEPAHVENAESK